MDNNINYTINDYIEHLKTTKFYKEKVDKLYLCDATPDTVWFKPKAEYTKVDEMGLNRQTEDYDYLCCDIDGAVRKNGSPYLLKEV
jgi:hypothetical protein